MGKEGSGGREWPLEAFLFPCVSLCRSFVLDLKSADNDLNTGCKVHFYNKTTICVNKVNAIYARIVIMRSYIPTGHIFSSFTL